ncbi:MAG: hypothetical protein AB1765_03505 [Candidatus Hydrogenedentota bacterium]
MGNLVSLEKKVKNYKKNLLKKRYEYNQRNTANRIWLILKKNLALAEEVIEISERVKNDLLKRRKIDFLLELETISDNKISVYCGRLDIMKSIKYKKLEKSSVHFINSSVNRNIVFMFRSFIYN